MDRAETVKHPQFMNEEGRNGRHDHQRHPDPAEEPVDGGSFGAKENEGTENRGRNNGGDMELHGKRCV
jgi:hypothetical protein